MTNILTSNIGNNYAVANSTLSDAVQAAQDDTANDASIFTEAQEEQSPISFDDFLQIYNQLFQENVSADPSVFVAGQNGVTAITPEELTEDSFAQVIKDNLQGAENLNDDTLKLLYKAISNLDGEEGISAEELQFFAALGNDKDINDGIQTDENGESTYNNVINENDINTFLEAFAEADETEATQDSQNISFNDFLEFVVNNYSNNNES